MEEKKQIKISLGTAICIFIIIILVIALGIVYYLGSIKDSKATLQIENSVKTAEKLNTQKKENFVIYSGGEIKGISSQCPTIDEENIEKYSTTYNIYKDGQNIGKYNGTAIKNEMDEYYVDFDNIDFKYHFNFFGISGDYNAIPRKHTETEDIPTIIKDKIPLNYELEKMETIDLDGDGKNENLVVYKYTGEDDSIIMKNKVVYSGVVLYDSDYKEVAKLASYEDTFYGGTEKACSITFSGIEYIDIDNDGIMEIVVDVNSYAYSRISIYKYHEGIVDGAVGLQFDPAA